VLGDNGEKTDVRGRILAMMSNSLKVLISVLTSIFSLASGLFLVRFLIPLYFLLFSALPKTLNNFYITVGVSAFLFIVLVFILFKTGRHNWGILISGMVILLLCFGVPVFMLENNHMLWEQAVKYRSGPVYFIEFSDTQIRMLQYVKNLFDIIWNGVYLFVYVYIGLYLLSYIYLHKSGWRIKGIRIKF
jgi:hypothetical protein